MTKFLRSVGHGLFAAGLVLVAMYLVGAYLKSPDALHEVMNPFFASNYLALLPLLPGLLIKWLSDHLSARGRSSQVN